MRLSHTLLSSALALAVVACGDAVSDVEVETDPEILTPTERFEYAYLGNWDEDPSCLGDASGWQIDDDRIRFGDTTCKAAPLPRQGAKIYVQLTECSGGSTLDSKIALDLAGDDILYVERGADRLRLNRCIAR